MSRVSWGRQSQVGSCACGAFCGNGPLASSAVSRSNVHGHYFAARWVGHDPHTDCRCACSVSNASPAAGVRPGDILLGVDGQEIASVSARYQALGPESVGRECRAESAAAGGCGGDLSEGAGRWRRRRVRDWSVCRDLRPHLLSRVVLPQQSTAAGQVGINDVQCHTRVCALITVRRCTNCRPPAEGDLSANLAM
jgi:hypothetical protein